MLIADRAGMGKTTVLTHLSREIKEENPNHWVVRIDLNAHTDVLADQNKTSISPESATDFISNNLLNLKTSLEKKMFNHLLEKKRVVVMLDGFDEISPSYKNIVIVFF